MTSGLGQLPEWILTWKYTKVKEQMKPVVTRAVAGAQARDPNGIHKRSTASWRGKTSQMDGAGKVLERVFVKEQKKNGPGRMVGGGPGERFRRNGNSKQIPSKFDTFANPPSDTVGFVS